ncbi:hypothetical protein LEP1GSC179_0693 [Leptospira santarosai str. MOR084]|uniref:Uncharacterized protein n=1 Tax=Leptospira santarosai str. MOR084 TaxID=1049984 RepID=A0A0E2BRW0_9LEPT|nr:hypothetical protein LEP1GSC179_0693 [Leptospira santarosai str. MOR084]
MPSEFSSFQSSLLSFDFPITDLSFSVMGKITRKFCISALFFAKEGDY